MADIPHADNETERNRNKEIIMRGAVLYGPRDVRFEEREVPKIIKPTDAVIRISSACVCGSDLWPYRGIQPTAQPTPMGHEYCGIVEEVGSAVKSVKRGQFVIGSFFASDNTCPNCHIGYQSSCQHRELVGGAQAPLLRVPLADGTLVATSDVPSEDLIPSLLTLSDVMGTGWFAADAASVKPGSTVVVVGDGAVGLLGVLSAKQMGAKRIIAMSRHASRQKLAREFGATDIVTERGSEGVARIKELTNGVGADSVLECVGTQESMMQAITSTRPGGYIGYVGVPHGVSLDGEQLFFSHVHLHGGPAPVRRYLPELIKLVLNGKINPGKVFDLSLPLDQVAMGYRAMDERRAIRRFCARMERTEGIRDEHMVQKLDSWPPAFQHALVGSEPSGCRRKHSQREESEHENQNKHSRQSSHCHSGR
jgi:threonine dehydrogenase-like Zn-dependent dehydrogenase